jgi:hypothetical protein
MAFLGATAHSQTVVLNLKKTDRIEKMILVKFDV